MFQKGNPFALELFPVSFCESNLAYVNKGVKLSTWYYKDLSGNIHGPYSTLEMYTWFAGGFFPFDLLICKNTKTDFNQFRQLTIYNTTASSQPLKMNV